MMTNRFKGKGSVLLGCVALTLGVAGLVFSGCSSERMKNQAKESAARYWQEKAYPGKSYDVQVIEAEKTGDGQYRVKGIVDGETRVGTFDPNSETFSEGYYSLAHEREKRVAELEQEVKYWKERADLLEKENYKLKVRLNLPTDDGTGAGPAAKPVSDTGSGAAKDAAPKNSAPQQ